MLAPEETKEDHKIRMDTRKTTNAIKKRQNMPINPRDDEDESHHGTTVDGDQLFQVMATLLSLTWQNGLTIINWLLIWNVMIEKLPGNPRIDKLHVIHIFDSLWNLSLGII
jgi:hypothetical protein